jgi:hypothetical protein
LLRGPELELDVEDLRDNDDAEDGEEPPTSLGAEEAVVFASEEHPCPELLTNPPEAEPDDDDLEFLTTAASRDVGWQSRFVSGAPAPAPGSAAAGSHQVGGEASSSSPAEPPGARAPQEFLRRRLRKKIKCGDDAEKPSESKAADEAG